MNTLNYQKVNNKRAKKLRLKYNLFLLDKNELWTEFFPVLSIYLPIFFFSTLLETSRNFLLLAREEVEKKPWQMQLA